MNYILSIYYFAQFPGGILIPPKRTYSDSKKLQLPSLRNNYLRTFVISLGMAFFFVFSLYGLYGMITKIRYEGALPIPIAIVFLILAVLFVVSYEFFSSRFVRRSSSLLIGFLAAFIVTTIILALIEFVLMAINGTIMVGGWENFVIAIAFCIIISVICLKYVESIR